MLPLVLQHFADISNRRTLCSLAGQHSNQLRSAAVSGSLPCYSEQQSISNSSAQLVSFARWLTKHSGLVRHLICGVGNMGSGLLQLLPSFSIQQLELGWLLLLHPSVQCLECCRSCKHCSR